MNIKQDKDMWLNADKIFEYGKLNYTKTLALVILQEGIKVIFTHQQQWNLLDQGNKQKMKQYAVNLLIKHGNQSKSDKQPLLSKVNSIIVQIVKWQWCTTWVTFVSDICQASKANQAICQNNLKILRMLSQEIFDFSKSQMTSVQTKQLKQRMAQQFSSIYNLCRLILDNGNNIKASLLKACLQTLLAFLSWIPIAYIFNTDLIEVLLRYLSVGDHRNTIMRCLLQISSIQLPLQQKQMREVKFAQVLMINTTNILQGIMSSNTDLAIERQKLIQTKSKFLYNFDQFCLSIVLLYTSLLTKHLDLLEQVAQKNSHMVQSIKRALNYLLNLTCYPQQRIFRVVVEFWLQFTKSLLNKGGFKQKQGILLDLYSQGSLKEHVYRKALIELRGFVVIRMVKPDQVKIEIDQNGVPRLVRQANTQRSNLCQMLKQLIQNLSKLDDLNMRNIITNRLQKQIDGSQWSYDRLNSVCWSLGAMAGTMQQNDQKSFLINCVKLLLNLCQNKKGRENKAVVASNVMYVVGQFPKFLNSNWQFLKTVVKKLFQFMKQQFPGIMQMACKTFLKISQHTQNQFLITKQFEPLIVEFSRQVPSVLQSLSQDIFRLIMYQGLGHIIAKQQSLQLQHKYILKIIEQYFTNYKYHITQIDKNISLVKQQIVMDNIMMFIKILQRLSFSVGFGISFLLSDLINGFVNLYICYSNIIKQEVIEKGKQVLVYFSIKKLRNVKKQILKLFTTFFREVQFGGNKGPQNMLYISQTYIPHLEKLLIQFNQSHQDLKQSQLVLLYAAIFQKLGKLLLKAPVLVPEKINTIFQYLFTTLLPLITFDFMSYPDLRMAFFALLKAVVTNCFVQLYSIPAQMFKTVIQCVVWSFKHQLNNINQIGLQLMVIILSRVNENVQIANKFYPIYFTSLITDVFQVLTDGFHQGGFKQESKILGLLIEAIVRNIVTVPVIPNQTSNNIDSCYQYLLQLLSSIFQTVSKQTTAQYLKLMFNSAATAQESQKNFRVR